MKKHWIAALVVCTAALCACGAKPTDASKPSNPSQQTEGNQQTETPDDSASLLAPLPAAITTDNLPDATLAAAFEAEDVKEADGVVTIDLTVYDYDVYDGVEVARLLEAGSGQMILQGERFDVTYIHEDENGYVYINGGIEQDGYVLAPGDGGTYHAIGFDDYKYYNEVTQATLPVSADCVLTDEVDLEAGPQTYTGAELLARLTGGPDANLGYHFGEYNTQVTTQEGQITAIHRIFTP